MSKKITRKVLEMLKKMADDSKKAADKKKKETEENKDAEEGTEKKEEEDQYATFWSNFGKSIKLGIIDDKANKAKLSKLLRFATSKSDGKAISLEEYIDRMKPKQKHVYFITGETLASVKNSPFLERLLKKDLEVVYMTDPLDEYLMQSMTEFDGHNFQSVSKEGLKFGDDDAEKERLSKLKDDFKDLTEFLKGVYGEKVEKVTVSNRIAKSPAILVTGQYGWSANMERIMKAQTFANAEEAKFMFAKKTMEINPFHPTIKAMKEKIAEGADITDKVLSNLAQLLYDAAVLVSGFQPNDPAEFAARIQRMVANELKVDPDAVAEEPEEPIASEENKTEEGSEGSDDSKSSSEEHNEEPIHDEL